MGRIREIVQENFNPGVRKRFPDQSHNALVVLEKLVRVVDNFLSFIFVEQLRVLFLFGWLKKRALLRDSPLKGEDVHEGPSINWFDIFCPTMVGSVRGVIYKVAITVTALRISPHTLIPTVANEISNHLHMQGTSAAQGLTIWEAIDGNVVLQPLPDTATSQLTVFVTSYIVKSLV